MPQPKYSFYVYILSSRSRDLYTGVTNNLIRRTTQHRQSTPGTYTAQYNIHRLVYFEHFKYINNAITREKQIKDYNRSKKVALIEKSNPTWEDLAADW